MVILFRTMHRRGIVRFEEPFFPPPQIMSRSPRRLYTKVGISAKNFFLLCPVTCYTCDEMKLRLHVNNHGAPCFSWNRKFSFILACQGFYLGFSISAQNNWNMSNHSGFTDKDCKGIVAQLKPNLQARFNNPSQKTYKRGPLCIASETCTIATGAGWSLHNAISPWLFTSLGKHWGPRHWETCHD